jgi:predicted regulator of amino acid metabolism with ACT domain
MKKSIYMMSVVVFVLGSVMTGCTDSAQKVEDAKDNVSDAEAELEDAQMAYLADVENQKAQTAAAVEVNRKNIAEFNARIANEKKELKAEYNLKIAELEKKNTDMQMKMADYKADSKEQWESFKAEFASDMQKLDMELKDLTSKKN